jgi:hypothetical protein
MKGGGSSSIRGDGTRFKGESNSSNLNDLKATGGSTQTDIQKNQKNQKNVNDVS